MNRSTVGKITKKFQEIRNTLDRPGRRRKRGSRSPQLLKNTREKLRRNPRRSCRTLTAAAGESKFTIDRCWGTIWGWSPSRCCIAKSLRPIMWPWRPKNAEKSSRRWLTAEPHIHGREKKWHLAGGKPEKWPSLGLLVIHRGKDRLQTPKSAVYHGLGPPVKETGRSLGYLCPLESHCTPSVSLPTFWRVACCPGPRSTSKEFPAPATEHCVLSRFQDHPVLESEKNSLIHKQGSLAGMSSDLNPLNFSIWSVLETKASPLPTQLWRLLRQNWWRSGSPTLRKRFVPPVSRSQSDWGP